MLVLQSFWCGTLHFSLVELNESSLDLVVRDCAKNRESLHLVPRGFRRIGKSNVQSALDLASEGGAILVRVIANSDDVVKGIPQELTHILWETMANINSNLLHDLDRCWVHMNRWLCACRVDL
jgi:hypothetical protein